MTLIIKSNGITIPNSMTPIDMVRALTDSAIVAIPSLKAWWRPDYALSGTGTGVEGSGTSIRWLDMVSQIALTAVVDTGPQLIASAHNSKPCLRFNSIGRNGRLHDAGANGLWRASASVTLVYVAKSNTGANTEIIGTNKATGYAMIQHASGGGIRVQHVNPTSLITTAAPGDTNPHIGLYSYDYSTHEWEFRINGASQGTGTAAAEVSAANLTIGGADSNGSFRGDFYEQLVFWDALHVAGNAAQLAAVEDYLAERYAL